MKVRGSRPTGTEIYETKDYEVFTLIESNRPIYPAHLRRLVSAIKHNNKLQQNPIRVSPDGEVLDGQHRLEAAKELNLPIFYYIDDSDTDVTDIVAENWTVKRWTLNDVINFWCANGKESFIKLREFLEKHPWMTAPVAVAVLQGRKSNSYINGRNRERFIMGEFEITDWQYATRFANAIGDFMKLIDFANDRKFMAAISYLLRLPDYDHERMIEQMERYGTDMERQVSQTEYLRTLEEVYNKYSRLGRTRFF